MKTVLITGGSGLVGRHLSKHLFSSGYNVHVLSRKTDVDLEVRSYFWDWQNSEIDESVFENLDYIVHLAGANIGEKLWTDRRKTEIVESRVKSIKFLLAKCKEFKVIPSALISASATGYYGIKQTNKIYTEKHESAEDFLGLTCKKWEEAADEFSELGTRVVKLRTGVVLARDGGMIKRLYKLYTWGLGSALGSGNQILPYIHIKDLVGLYKFSIENENLSGVYNAVSPEFITNLEFSRNFARIIGRPILMPNIPAFILRATMGEMAEMILNGNMISPAKIEKCGFNFEYKSIENALGEILKDMTN